MHNFWCQFKFAIKIMPLITYIPERFESGFAELGNLTNKQFIALESVLKKKLNRSSINGLVASIKLEEIQVYEILLSVGSIIPYIDKKELIEEVIEDISYLCELEEIVEKEKIDSLKNRLSFLLHNENLFIASKSEDLLSNYGNAFISCRTITDIRPVFSLELKSPEVAVIVHNLNIHYQSNEHPYHKNINLLMTSDDIKGLREALNRAEDKEGILKRTLNKTKISTLI